jgi:hypothetical protein
MSEEWRPVPGFPGYEASSIGRVRSWLRLNGFSRPPSEPRVLSAAVRGGYLSVVLRSGRRRVNMPVHRAVLLTFVGPCPEGMEGCHNDGSRFNNEASNLRWDTRRGNFADRDRHGTTARGLRHGRYTMPERTARGERHGMWKSSRSVSQ